MFRFLKASYEKLKNAFRGAGSFLGKKLLSLFGRGFDEKVLGDLEETLYEADLGVALSSELANSLRAFVKENPSLKGEDALEFLKAKLLEIAKRAEKPWALPPGQTPYVLLLVGVNGNGKTTTTAKLARYFKNENESILVGAADTFRAGAIAQLELWAKKLGIEIVKGLPGGDPAAVAFDAISAGKARGVHYVLIDTAGRLHTKDDLMKELQKIERVCKKAHAPAPQETLLILDATTGQNAIDQARTFLKFLPITGLILTKLDGTSKGGIALAIQQELGLPIRFIGVGEGEDDLQPFDAKEFVDTLLSL